MAYEKKRMKAPRAAGATLRMLAPIAENRVTGGLLSKTMLSNAGILAFREVEASGSIPFVPPQGCRCGESAPSEKDVVALFERIASASIDRKEGFSFESASEFVAAYRQGRSSPIIVAKRIIKHILESDETEPALRAFVAQDAQDLLDQAHASALRYSEKRALGPLDGVPVAVKDELDQIGYPTKVGTKFLGSAPAIQDAESVAQLRAQGALLIGKTNMHEIGLGVTGVNAHFGAARNPNDLRCVTGGSSSGSAASVAAGFCPIAVGADGGGSIRIPASLCGVVGLKPTFGRISEHGAAPLCWSVAHVGPIGATAKDVALAYVVMAGVDSKDPNTFSQPAVDLEGFGNHDLSGVRLGIYPAWFEDADPEVVDACKRVVDGLKRKGCEVKEIEIPELSFMRTVHLVIIVSEMAAALLAEDKGHRKDFAHDTRLNLAIAQQLKASDYVHAQRHRVRLCTHFDHALEQIDAIVTPTTACTAPVIPKDALKTGESNLAVTDKIMRFTSAANLTGLPAISLPAGYDQNGLPIGIQLIGRAFEEHLLLRIADAADDLVHRCQPKVYFRLLD
ncbi:MAG: amidase [Pseudomonadota bacterium]